MSARVSALLGEKVSHLIGLIYDCVLAPERWSAAVDAIRAEFGFHNGTLSSVAIPTGDHILAAVAGISPYWLARMTDVADALPDLWGGPDRIAQYPLEEPIINSQACEPGRVAANRYFREWAQPQGTDDAVVIGLEREHAMVANVAFGRHASAGPVDEVMLDGLRLLAPHLRRAVNISRILEVKSIEAASFAAVLESHQAGIAMVDAHLRVHHANKAAHAMFRAGDAIQLRRGRLGLVDRMAERALGHAVALCATDEALLSHRSGTGIAFRRQDGEACVVHALPLKQRTSIPDAGKQAVVALFVTMADRALTSLPSRVLDALFGMTPAETRVFALIVEGLTPPEAAARLGIAVSTCKSHLARVFEKTGCRRQADLTRIARSLAAPL